MQPLEARRLLAAVSWDGGGDGVNWTSANNWSTNALPQPGDDVTIDIAGTPTINLNGANATINSLTTNESLNLNSGVLSLAAASSAAADATVTMNGATLTGAGTFTVNGPLAFNSGTMAGSGMTIAKGNSTIGSGSGYTSIIDTRVLRIDGSATLATASGYHTAIAADARIRVASGGTLSQGNGSQAIGAGAVVVDAGGTLTRSVAGSGNIDARVENSGTVSAAAGATLNLNNSVTTGGTFAGSGIVQIYGGTHTFSNASTAASVTFNQIGGTIDGAGTLTVNGPFNWTSGIMQGTGTVDLKGTAVLGATNAYTYLRGSRMIRVTGGTTSFGSSGGYYMSVAADARIVAAAGGTLEATIAGRNNLINGDGGNGTGAINVEAGGLFTRTAATGSATINIPVNNLGTIDVDAGTLDLVGGGTSAATMTPAPGAGIGLNLGGNWAYNDGTLMSGGGIVTLVGGTHTVNAGVAANAVTVATGTTLAVDQGTVEGAGNINVAAGATFAPRRGTLQGSGTTTVFGHAVLGSNNGYLDLAGSYTLRVRGTAAFALASGYDIGVGTNARLVAGNGGTIDFTSTGDLQFFAIGAGNMGRVVVESGGTITRTGAGIEYIDIPVDNQGGGTIRAAAGSVLALAAGSTHAAGASFAGPGTVRLTGGNHTINGATTVAAGGVLDLNGNTVIDGAGTLTVNGSLLLTYGRLAGSATTLISATGTATVGSGSQYVSIRDTHQLRVAGTATMGTASGYDVRVGADARIVVLNGGTFDFSGPNPELFGIGGADGTGLLVINAGGTLTRTLAGGGDSIALPVQNSGTIRAAAGADFGISAGSTQLAGATIAGPGNVHFNGGTHTVAGATTIVAGGNLLHTTGTIDGAATLTVDGTLNMIAGVMAGTGTTLIRSATSTLGSGSQYYYVRDTRAIRIEGKLTMGTNGGYNVRLAADARVIAASGGTFDFAGPNPEIIGDGGNGTGAIVVEAGGTLIRTAAGGDSIDVPVLNNGTVRAAAGSDLGLRAGSTQNAGAAIAGPGNVWFNGGTHTIDGATNVAVGGTLILDNATLSGAGTLTVDGTANINRGTISGSGTTVLRGTTSTIGTNNGYLTMLGTHTIRVDGTAAVTTAGGYEVRLGTGTNLTVASGGTLRLDGSGEVRPAGGANGTGTLTVQTGGTLLRNVGGNAPVSATFNNFGTVQIDASTITFSGTTNAGTGAFLSGGAYRVNGGGNLAFSPGLTTLTADVELSGTSTASGLNALAINRGRIGLTGGADLTVDPAGATRHKLEGILDLSPGSVFTAVGGMDLGGTSQPIVRSEIASATDFGKVVVTGSSLNLNSPDSTSRFDPDLVGGYDPATGTQFAILTAPSVVNSFDNIQGGLTPSNNVIGAYTNATTYGAQIIPGPPPPAPQILSTSFEWDARLAVVFTFNQDVSAFLARKDYVIENLTTGQTIAQSAGTLTYNPASNEATLLLSNQLPDGNYRLTVSASDIANSAGVAASGSPIVLSFYVLAGDADRDRDVDFNDLLLLAKNYNGTGKTFSQGNFNYSGNGAVDFDDLLLLAKNYNKTLAPPAPAAAAAAAAATRRRVSETVIS